MFGIETFLAHQLRGDIGARNNAVFMKHMEDAFGDLAMLEIRGFRASAMFHGQAFRREVWPEYAQALLGTTEFMFLQ